MSFLYRFISLSILLLVTLSMFTQPSRAAVDYLIGPDDVIEISVLNHNGMDKVLTVLPDGTITYPWVGQLKAAGRTPKQLAAQIRFELEKTRNNVEVTVAVREVLSQRVRIVGAVKAASAYNLKPNGRLLDIIAAAGGLTARPKQVRGRIVRDGGKILPLDLSNAIAIPDSEANSLLQANDLILLDEIDPTLNKVYVMGQVTKPGAYVLGDEGISILSLLSQAGNPTEAAALSRTYILRGTTHIPINLRSILVGGKPDESARNLSLEAGDVLVIPEIEQRIAVMGQVNKPGYYSLPETRGLTALDALSLAGGQSQTGDLRKAGIIRLVNNQAEVIPLDIEQMLQKGNLVTNVSLQPNDVLFIPSRGNRNSILRDVISPITSLLLMGVRLFR